MGGRIAGKQDRSSLTRAPKIAKQKLQLGFNCFPLYTWFYVRAPQDHLKIKKYIYIFNLIKGSHQIASIFDM